ncbi:MAG TPA: hypothetical protein PLV68_08295, partial [Ilumatobacteraceae bacterium]|nr:hypothetical protein [Ilumatobacteraceae bacterium]
LQESVAKVAVSRYLGTNKTGIDLLVGNLGPTEQAQAVVLSGVVNDVSEGVMDRYEALDLRLDNRIADLADSERRVQAAADEFDKRQAEAEAEVARLKAIEKDRLEIEAVRRALEAQRQREVEALQREMAEQLRRDQDAAIAFQEGGGSDGGD